MKKAKWIWYYGEFEIYHSLLLHSRREDIGCDYPSMWSIDTPFPLVEFKPNNKIIIKEDTVLHIHAKGKGLFWLNWEKYPVNCDVKIKKGEYNLQVNVMRTDGSFPSIFIDNEYFCTNENWTADFGDRNYIPVGCEPSFKNCTDNPEVFPFSYKKIKPVATEKLPNGFLYDFGKETMAKITVETESEDNSVFLCYGESKEESLDFENAIIFETLSGKKKYIRPARALRYLFVSDSSKITAEYEYLPIKDIASFKCEDELLNKIYETSVYTFHLNTREFYLDGIKRDRWVWSGDAYQSFMINNYLYKDKEIIKRTITALLGKPPIVQHINTINDYTMYLFISLYDYYLQYEDEDFVKRTFGRIKNLYSFLTSRLDDNGLVCEKPGDWIFIDWAELDKSGPLCAEQILLWKTYLAMAELSKICNEEYSLYIEKAKLLKEFIFENFWSEQKGAFIDCFTSGKNRVTRHANIFAILFNFVEQDKKQSIINNVLKNNEIDEITTPFFKLFELIAMCECDEKEYAFNFIKSYWGGMINLGATSIWEQFDPNQSGNEHLAMYGAKYGKSLCHAWGSGPILLLMKYFAGVKITSIKGKTFTVSPDFSFFKQVDCCVPVGEGTVSLNYNNGKLTVKTNINGGTLIYKEEKLQLNADETVSL